MATLTVLVIWFLFITDVHALPCVVSASIVWRPCIILARVQAAIPIRDPVILQVWTPAWRPCIVLVRVEAAIPMRVPVILQVWTPAILQVWTPAILVRVTRILVWVSVRIWILYRIILFRDNSSTLQSASSSQILLFSPLNGFYRKQSSSASLFQILATDPGVH